MISKYHTYALQIVAGNGRTYLLRRKYKVATLNTNNINYNNSVKNIMGH